MLEEFMVRSNYIQLACLDETAQRDLYTEMTVKKTQRICKTTDLSKNVYYLYFILIFTIKKCELLLKSLLLSKSNHLLFFCAQHLNLALKFSCPSLGEVFLKSFSLQKQKTQQELILQNIKVLTHVIFIQTVQNW